MVRLKKGFMKYIWRLQQSQMIVGVFYWSLTLAGIFYPYLSPVFDRFGLVGPSQVALGLLILFVIVLLFILFIGYIYDKTFKMWAEQRIIQTERNIFALTRQSAKEIVFWQYNHLPFLIAHGLKAEAEFFNRWNERCVEEDKILLEDVYKIAKWTNEYKSPPGQTKSLRKFKEDMEKKYKLISD
jgi:hypothetical protein